MVLRRFLGRFIRLGRLSAVRLLSADAEVAESRNLFLVSIFRCCWDVVDFVLAGC